MMKKIIVSIASVAILAFLWWTVSPLFINTEVNDELPSEFSTSMSEEEMAEVIANTPDMTMDDPMPQSIRIQAVPTDRTDTTPTTFPIIDTPTHPATGQVRILESAETDQQFVRFENYDGTNGPDLFIYLTNDLAADDFVSLGRSKGNVGNINYAVPAGVDVHDYRYVVTWCQAFGVLFDYAEVN